MSNKNKEIHDLVDFVFMATEEMSHEYKSIQKKAIEDPGTAGDRGEESWAELFRNWLPPIYHVVTKGRILGLDGVLSPQVDVLILNSSYPRKLINKKIYLAGGVCAAFECKVTLRKHHIVEAVKNSVEIKEHLPMRIGSPFKELHSSIVFGLLAHSSCWKSKGANTVKVIDDSLNLADSAFVHHPRNMLDIICVADVATWITKKTPWYGPMGWQFYRDFINSSKSKGSPATSAYASSFSEIQGQTHSFSPIGVLIANLLYRLAREDPNVRNIAEYFRAVLPSKSIVSKLRYWDDTVYSGQIRDKVTNGNHLVGGIMHHWDEWSEHF